MSLLLQQRKAEHRVRAAHATADYLGDLWQRRPHDRDAMEKFQRAVDELDDALCVASEFDCEVLSR